MKQLLIIFFVVLGFAVLSYLNLEPSPILAINSTQIGTSTVSLTVDSDITMTGCNGAVAMSPNINLTQDSSVASTTCSITTSDANGYSLSMKASTSPALHTATGGNNFTDVATNTVASWSVSAAQRLFGFSVYGNDVDTGRWGTQSGAGCGSANAASFASAGTLKWMGFYTSATTTVTRTSATSGGAVDTNLCIAAEQGNSSYAPSGLYQASIVVTAQAL